HLSDAAPGRGEALRIHPEGDVPGKGGDAPDPPRPWRGQHLRPPGRVPARCQGQGPPQTFHRLGNPGYDYWICSTQLGRLPPYRRRGSRLEAAGSEPNVADISRNGLCRPAFEPGPAGAPAAGTPLVAACALAARSGSADPRPDARLPPPAVAGRPPRAPLTPSPATPWRRR